MKMYPGSTWESHQVNAVWNPLKDTGTNMPYVSFADKELGESPLYYNSLTAAALLIDKTVMPNFGHLPTGIIMGIINKGDQLGYIFPADFTVTIYDPNCLGMDEEHIRRVLFHELLHVGTERDGNEESYFLRPHDVEDFRAILDTYGLGWSD